MPKIKKSDLYIKFLGFLIKRGNKVSAKKLLDKIFTKLSHSFKANKIKLLLIFFLKLNVFCEVKKINLRKRSFIIPFPLYTRRRSYLALKWLLSSVKENHKRCSIGLKIFKEIKAILMVKGKAKRNKIKTVKLKKINSSLSFFNRSNSHYRW